MKSVDSLIINLPFSYMWLLKKSIGDSKAILDLGCGEGELMQFLSRGEKWQITGIDIYEKAIEKARKRNIYHKLIRGDVLKTVRNHLKSKYDVIFCSQIIEHLTRSNGEEILNEIERLAKRRIVIGTPRGFMVHPHEFSDGNPYQIHKSGWSIEDFTLRGYKVYGVGFWPIWSYYGLGRDANAFRKALSNIISYLAAPLVYFFPSLAVSIVAIKERWKVKNV